MKKTWVKVRSGLLEPKHRKKLGARIWLYLHILDRADWDTGTVKDWTDGDTAKRMKMPQRTVQDQRQRLVEDGYISSVQSFQSLTITIHNWVNPREYSGEVYNGTEKLSPSRKQEFRTHGNKSSVPIQSESSVPLPSSSHINHIKESQLKEGRKRPTPARKRDDRLDHPAIKAYRDEAHLTVPHAARDAVCSVQDVRRWRGVVKKWITKGFRPQNIEGMLDWYRNGERKNTPVTEAATADDFRADAAKWGYDEQ